MNISAFAITTSIYFATQQASEGLKMKAIKEYKQALLLPRKKKKQVKKSALLLYSIACWGDTIY
jgi:hypothetical protein